MDVGINEEQEFLRRTARETLEGLCPGTVVRAAEKDVATINDLWNKFANLGWLGLPFPEENGGAGSDLLTLLVLIEELGFAAAPGPYLATVAQAGTAITRLGTAEQRATYLPALSNGTTIATLAIAEQSTQFGSGTFATTITDSGDTITVNGAKAYVPMAELADVFVVVGKLGDGIGAVVVEKGDGVAVEAQRTLAGEPVGIVRFDNISVPKDRLLGNGPVSQDDLDQVIVRAQLSESAYMLGAADRAFQIATKYASERVQFGRPIGTFQAISHQCADMAIDVDSARMLIYQAAWMLDEGETAGAGSVAMAKRWGGLAGRRIVARSHQVHGAIGFTSEYDLNLFTRRVKAHEFVFGLPQDAVPAIARHIGLEIDAA